MMSVLNFTSEDDGDGTFEGQIGRARLRLDDGSTGADGRDLGLITLAAAIQIADEHAAGLDLDGMARNEWDFVVRRRSLLSRLLSR